MAAGSSDEDARTAVVALLGRQLDAFPADLRQLFRAASAISDDQPFLEQRLAALGARLDRGPRAVRRRLRQAEQLLADSLLQELGPRGGLPARGWQWVCQSMELTLGERAVVDLDRTLLALDDHQKFITESFFLAEQADGDRIEVVALEGLDLVRLETRRQGLWELTLQLSREVPSGREIRTRLRVTVSRARALSPFLALLPVRPTRRLSTTVHFGTPPAARRAWIQDGVCAPAMARPAIDQVFLDLDADPDVSATFDSPELGVSYGIAWDWA